MEKWHFKLTKSACNYLLDPFLKGKKKATSSSFPGYQIEGEALPEEGRLSVITDREGNPRCAVRTTRVRIIPYKDITFDIAKLEGEDESLESWRKDHEAFFRAEGEALGYRFSENMDVVFEEFEVAESLNSRSDINGRGNEYPYSVRYPDASVHRVQSRADRIPDHFIPKNAANCLMT